MLVALLMQAAIAQATLAPPPASRADATQILRDRAAELERRRACNMRVIEAMEQKGVADGVRRVPEIVSEARLTEPLYRPGELPDEGLYAAVERRVDGCPVPTPIALRKAPIR